MCEIFIAVRTGGHIIKMYTVIHIRYHYSCHILLKLHFSKVFRKFSNVLKIRPVGAEAFHADGECDSHSSIKKDIKNVANSRLCDFGRAFNK